ncbi:MAG: lysylphosphatidylglycerol synthase transmembrane domain-containing protein [Planctomycetota bacterium]|nr:lysylphosphatidylglycerol synthase transmembrane domain-containing protein [Planctomycetota bacterium]
MSPRVVTVVKWLFVAAMMYYVSTLITLEDRLVTRRDQQVVAAEVVEILGDWRADPIRFRVDGVEQSERASRVLPDGRVLEVQPGFVSYLRSLDVGWFALGVGCYILTVMLAGARWWWLLRVNGMNVSLLEALRYTWIGVFFNTVFPGSTGGDVLKALYIMKRCPGHRVEALVSVGVDRILGLGSLALLGAFCVLFALEEFATIAAGIWGVILGVGLLGVVAFSRRLRERVRLKWLLNRLPTKIRSALQMVDKAIFFYREQRVVIGASLLLGVLNHAISVLAVVCFGVAIGVGMPAFEYFVLVPVINIASAIPIAPNGWGVGELLYGYLFAEHGAQHLVGVSDAAAAMRTRGVALSLLYRAVLTAFSCVAGLLVLFEKDRVTRADIDREVARDDG